LQQRRAGLRRQPAISNRPARLAKPHRHRVLPKPVSQSPGLVFFLQLHDNNLDRFITGVDAGVHRVGRVCGEPVCFAGFPDTRLSGAILFGNLHGPARQSYDYAWMFMPMHGEGCVWKNDGLPHPHVFIFEQRNSLSAWTAGDEQRKKSTTRKARREETSS
jgi:hypothetical protein